MLSASNCSSGVAQGGNMMGMAPSNQGADGNAGYQNSGGFPSTGPPQSNYGESSPPPSSGRRYSSNESKKRLFIVSQPDRISTSRLSDMFSKFGNFISVNYIPGKNYGFAKFGSEESADNAQRYMHGETISGNHLKCLDAEDPPPESKKSKT